MVNKEGLPTTKIDFSPLLPSVVVNNVPRVPESLERKVLMVFGAAFAAYVIWNDVSLYNHIMERKPDGFPPPPSNKEGFDPMTDLTVKLIMSSPVEHYVLIPAAHAGCAAVDLGSSFITPNMVTIVHFVVGILGAKLAMSDSLLVRKLAVLLLILRMFLDDVDGVLARSKLTKDKRYLQTTTTGTFGQMMDACIDFTSQFIFLLFVLLYHLANKPKDYHSLLPLFRNSDDKPSGPVHWRIIFLRWFWVGNCFGAAACFWDRYLFQFSQVLENSGLTPDQKILQNDIFTSTTTWTIFWLWRMACGPSVVTYILISVFIDKSWEFAVFAQYVGTFIYPLLVAASELHLHYMRNYVRVDGDFYISEFIPIFMIPVFGIPVCCFCNTVKSSRFRGLGGANSGANSGGGGQMSSSNCNSILQSSS